MNYINNQINTYNNSNNLLFKLNFLSKISFLYSYKYILRYKIDNLKSKSYLKNVKNLLQIKLKNKLVDNLLNSMIINTPNVQLEQGLSNILSDKNIKLSVFDLTQLLNYSNKYNIIHFGLIFKYVNEIRQSFWRYDYKEFLEAVLVIYFSFLLKNPKILATYIATQIEQQKQHNRFIRFFNKILFIMSNKNFLKNYNLNFIEGIRIEFKGRLNGIQRARKRVLQRGRLPLSTLDIPIKYFYIPAKTPYGTVGVHVSLALQFPDPTTSSFPS